MAPVPEKVAARLVAGINRFQPILIAARARNAGKADTTTIIKGMLADVFGYDEYAKATSEHATRETHRNQTTETDAAERALLEVKAVGNELADPHVKPATDYATSQGVDWLLLTNGISWQIYHLSHARLIGQDLVVDIDFLALDPQSEKDIELLYLMQRGLAAIGPWRMSHIETSPVEIRCRDDALRTGSLLEVIRR